LLLFLVISKGELLNILDNEKIVLDSIPQKMIDILYDFPNQFKTAENIIRKLTLSFNKKYKNSIILGVGSSSNTAYRLITSIEINKLNIPIVLFTKATIPPWVNKDTLVIAISHSGNSIEIIEAVDKVLEFGCEVFAITTGGALKQKAEKNKNIKIIQYKADMISRMAIGYIYVLLVNILNKAGAVDICSDRKDCLLGIDWDEVENAISKFSQEVVPGIKTHNNIAKKTAINIFNKFPVIYGSNRLTGTVSYRLKNQICMNSNNFAHYNTLPEMDHGEIAAWEMKYELRNKFFVIFITDHDSKEETKRRVEIMKGILIEKGINFEEIILEGPSDAAKALSGIFLADWISVYLSVLNKTDPTSTKLLDLMKRRFEQVSSS